MERVGIFGGTFDPIHLGHLGLAEEAMKVLGLQRIIFVPAATPPHKLDGREISQYLHRYRMVAQAIAPYPQYGISNLEYCRGGKSYTYDTVIQFQELLPEAELYFLTGTDSINELTTWYHWQALLDCCYVVGVARMGYGLKLDEELIRQDAKSIKGLILLDVPVMEISATEIRRCYHAGKRRPEVLPKCVADYIEEKQLYQ